MNDFEKVIHKKHLSILFSLLSEKSRPTVMARILFAFVCLIARVSTTLAAGKLVQELNPKNKQHFKTQRDRIVA